MGTTVHLSPYLLAMVERRALDPGVSRNRYIVRALEHAVAETRWSAAFAVEFAAARADPEGRAALAGLRAAVTAGRTRKRPPTL